MGGEPPNAAVEVVTMFVARLNDRDFFVNQGSSLVTADFVRYDERRFTAHPAADAQAWIDAAIELEAVAGEWPRMELRDVLAIRGNRLAAVLLATRLDERAVIMESIVVVRVDESCARFEVMYYFDPEDRVRGITRLDELHAELGV